MIKVAINGCGRIGKNCIRTFISDPAALQKIRIAALNIGPEDPHALAYSLKYDSLLGAYNGSIMYKEGVLWIDSLPPIPVFSSVTIHELPWQQLKVDWVIEASGTATHADKARQHIASGASGVLITAPAYGDDSTIILGVNHALFDAGTQKIVSLGSCTTNAVVPLLATVMDHSVIISAAMTTVHAYTNTQSLLDVRAESSDLRRSRAAGLNMVPTTTGAMALVERIFPVLAGKIVGASIRVPVPVVSLIDLTCFVEESLTTDDLHALCLSRQANSLPGVYATTTVPLVSSDFAGSSASVTVDLGLSYAQGRMIKLFGWYDNEWGYSCRVKDFFLHCVD